MPPIPLRRPFHKIADALEEMRDAVRVARVELFKLITPAQKIFQIGIEVSREDVMNLLTRDEAAIAMYEIVGELLVVHHIASVRGNGIQ